MISPLVEPEMISPLVEPLAANAGRVRQLADILAGLHALKKRELLVFINVVLS